MLGLLLGDGGFTQRLMFCSADRELLDLVRAEHERCGGRMSREIERRPGFWHVYLRAGTPYDRAGNRIEAALEQVGLMGLRDHQKFIPKLTYVLRLRTGWLSCRGCLIRTETCWRQGQSSRSVRSNWLAVYRNWLARSAAGRRCALSSKSGRGFMSSQILGLLGSSIFGCLPRCALSE